MTEPGTIGCPRCNAPVGPEQSWCLNCGAAARTRMAPTPNWRLPVAAVGAVVALAGVVLALAFVRVTGNNDTPSQTITTTAAPAATTAAPAPSTTAAPAPGSTPQTTSTASPEVTTVPPNQPVPTQTSPGG
jgi:hypothetical protein